MIAAISVLVAAVFFYGMGFWSGTKDGYARSFQELLDVVKDD